MIQSAEKFGIAFIACLLAILLSTTALAENKMTPGQIPPCNSLSGYTLSKSIARSNSAEKLPDITNKNLRDKILPLELLGEKGDAPESGAFFTNATDAKGPWFQGWYTRITDANGASIAVVGATQYLPGTPIPDYFYLPGYLAVIICDHGLTKVYETFPERTAFWNNRTSVLEDPESPYWEEFFWYSEENGVITNEYIDVSIPGGIDVEVSLGPRLPYDSTDPWFGPEGLVEFLPFVPLHWFVYSLGSDATYTYTLLDEEGDTVSGSGFAHQESNWGVIFPPAWVWAEGINSDNSRQFSLSGGELMLGDTSLTTWFVAYRSPLIKWQFRPTLPGTEYITSIDSCAGSFSIIAKDSFRTLVITAHAPQESFFDVSVPTEDGFVLGAEESFSAEVSIRGYIKWPWFGDILIDSYQFSGAALEFGAGYMCE
ncbi:MAG: hypothetical protein JRJ40_04195 [Deltaproteobacteria bacterium]|nr:hypothetical protein [Deltaproteobacteria bacterium]